MTPAALAFAVLAATAVVAAVRRWELLLASVAVLVGVQGASLVKIFLYDLAELSSVARAASFVAVGALLLVGGFFVQRLAEREERSAA